METQVEVQVKLWVEGQMERQVETVAALPPEVGSSWCPPIYFNHQCYSASFLSRHRLESLPR